MVELHLGVDLALVSHEPIGMSDSSSKVATATNPSSATPAITISSCTLTIPCSNQLKIAELL